MASITFQTNEWHALQGSREHTHTHTYTVQLYLYMLCKVCTCRRRGKNRILSFRFACSHICNWKMAWCEPFNWMIAVNLRKFINNLHLKIAIFGRFWSNVRRMHEAYGWAQNERQNKMDTQVVLCSSGNTPKEEKEEELYLWLIHAIYHCTVVCWSEFVSKNKYLQMKTQIYYNLKQ